MSLVVNETLQLIEKFLMILKEAGILKSYYLNFCHSNFKSDQVFNITFQHLFENLKEVFFKIYDKWLTLRNIEYSRKVRDELDLHYNADSYFKKSPEHCLIIDKEIDSVINSCSLSDHTDITTNLDFDLGDSSKLDEHLKHLKDHDSLNSRAILRDVSLSSALNPVNNCPTSTNQSISNRNNTSLDTVHFPVYCPQDDQNQAIDDGSSALNEVLSLQKQYDQVENDAVQNQSCLDSDKDHNFENVLGLCSAFSSTENINKIESSIMTSDMTDVMSEMLETSVQHLHDSSSSHAGFADDALGSDSLESEVLLGGDLSFSSQTQSTVDTSVLNNSSSNFPTFYTPEKNPVSETNDLPLFSDLGCDIMNDFKEKTNSCVLNRDTSENRKTEPRESKNKNNFQELVKDGTKFFQCDHCGQMFTSAECVKSHLSQMHKISPNSKFACELCEKTFASKNSLQLHIESFHDGVKPFECHICFRRFSQKVVRDNHVVGHTGQYLYGCDECGKRFAAKNKLKFHMLSHKDPQFKCNVCDKLFTTKQYLQNHQKIHENSSPKDIVMCDLCNVICANQTALLKHKRYKHRTLTFFCDFPGCNKSFVTRSMLQRHQDRLHNVNKKMYDCQHCDKSFSQEKSLHHHVKQNHTAGLSEEQLRPFNCTICNKRYAFSNKLKLHMMTHTQEPPHCCSLCTKTFYRLDLLKLHMSSKHFYSDQMCSKSLMCNMCGQSFTTKANLKAHKALHNQAEETLSFDCNLCKKVFKSKNALEYHLKKHEGKLSFECSFCSKKFVRKCYLDDHLQTHLNEKCFKCDLCTSIFKRHKHLREHLRRVHPNHITVDSLLESITSESSDQQNLLPAIKEELRISLAAL